MIDSRYITGFALGAGSVFLIFLFGGLLDSYTLEGLRNWVGAFSGWIAAAGALGVGLPTLRWIQFQAQRPIIENEIEELEVVFEELLDAWNKADFVMFVPGHDRKTLFRRVSKHFSEYRKTFFNEFKKTPQSRLMEFQTQFRKIRRAKIRELREVIERSGSPEITASDATSIAEDFENEIEHFIANRLDQINERKKELQSKIDQHRA